MPLQSTDTKGDYVDISQEVLSDVPKNEKVTVEEEIPKIEEVIPKVEAPVDNHEHTKKRKNIAIEDDFFALASFSTIKKSKKSRKNKNKVSEVKKDSDPSVEVLDDTSQIESSDINSVPLKHKSVEYKYHDSSSISQELDDLLSSNLSDDSDDEVIVLNDEVEKLSPSDNYKPETNRAYCIKISNKLSTRRSTKYPHKIQATGVTMFREIMHEALTYFNRSSQASTDEDACLVWIDGRMELKPFFKPSTLRVPHEKNSKKVTELNCLLIPKENISNFLNIYEEFLPKTQDDFEQDLKFSDQTTRENVANDDDNDDVIIINENSAALRTINNNSQGFFNIGLKGRDNKRITVEVGPKTKIRALLQHYLKLKNINSISASQAKLIFDDEELDLDGVIGDTELEEDFEVQIVI